MNYKEYLVQEQGSYSSVYLKFIEEYRKYSDNTIVCFVEGKDSSYYRYMIERIKNNEIVFISCEGKKNVETVKNEIEKRNINTEHSLLYFCDRDYDLYKKKEGIFYTDYYSIENYYCSRTFIDNVLKKVFNYREFDEDYSKCMNLFDNSYNLFSEEIKKINAYAYAIRLNEKNNNSQRYALPKKILNKIIKNKDLMNISFKEINKEFINKNIITEIDIDLVQYENSFSMIDETKRRGKWELEFIVFFLEKLRLAIENGHYGITKKDRHFITFNNEIMESMKTCADSSESLDNYINSIVS